MQALQMQVEILKCSRPHRDLVYGESRVRLNTYPSDCFSLTQHLVSNSYTTMNSHLSTIRHVLSGKITDFHTTILTSVYGNYHYHDAKFKSLVCFCLF